MLILDNVELEVSELPDLQHRTIGGHEQGLKLPLPREAPETTA